LPKNFKQYNLEIKEACPLATSEELDWIQQNTKAKQLGTKIIDAPTEVKQERTEIKQNPLEIKPQDIDLIPPNLRTKEQWAEIIAEGTKSKAHFTVTIPKGTNDKFNDLMVYYDNKFALGRVYKHYVLSIIIHDHWNTLKRQGLV
jgi:hypothetical protein